MRNTAKCNILACLFVCLFVMVCFLSYLIIMSLFINITIFTITDINDCVNHKCQNGGSCADGVGNYSCICLPGYTGNRCETGKHIIPFP